jgi:TIR domain
MTEPSEAVFLSYASQDAEAAHHICDALRSAGVEVWFSGSALPRELAEFRRGRCRTASLAGSAPDCQSSH